MRVNEEDEMLIQLNNKILENYPGIEIGYLTAQVIVRKSDPFVEALKQTLGSFLKDQNMNATNFTAHPSIAIWRKIYEEDFQVKAKTYRSSIEALLRRVVTRKDIWNICNIVDLYNCCSVLSLLPMGGYDLAKVTGDIEIRYGRDAETFLGLGERAKVEVKPHHVVYADAERTLCWLWNHKDSAETCIDENTKAVIFFIDSFDPEKTQAALKQLAENLEKIGCLTSQRGILNHIVPQTKLNI